MKILIVEDQPEKACELSNHLDILIEDELNICVEDSLKSGLMHLISQEKPDFLVLDMSMPKFSSSNNTLDSEPASDAGKELMKQMKIREILVPTIVVTQYSIFEKGNVTLEKLDLEFKEEFKEFYIGSVFYNSASHDWKDKFNFLLGKIND